MGATKKAPKGQFRVVGVDTFDNMDWVEGDFKNKKLALAYADSKGGQMLKMHVYDDKGNNIHDAGTF